nr:TetR/AcrR family transcriptional regulator [Clostridioides difficile]
MLECAKVEFLSFGFQNVSMRKIADNANVTTGAMYNHFKNKEILFDELVSKTATELLTLFKHQHDKCSIIESYNLEASYNMMSQSTDCVLDFIYNNFEEMKLIVCSSQGTRYEKYVESLIEIEEESTRNILIKSDSYNTKKDDFFIHVMSSSCMHNMFEAIKHDLSKEEAVYYMEKIKHFYYAGWNEMLDFKCN